MDGERHALSAGLRLAVQNRVEALETFNALGQKVGPRRGPNRRTHTQKELFNLRQYMTTLAYYDRLTFPLKIAKTERPDFMVCDGRGTWFGLDVTEATTEEFQREPTETEGVEASQDSGDGFVGDALEEECCAALLRAITRKARLVSTGSYPTAEWCDVLVYVNLRLHLLDTADVARQLKASIPAFSGHWNKSDKLGSVSVIMGNQLYRDVTGDFERLPLFNAP